MQLPLISRFAILCLIFLTLVSIAQDLPTQESVIFSGSGNCVDCHAPGEPNLDALRGPNGEDISAVTQWRSTMMANAARDPFWQAKVSTEVLQFPEWKVYIEDKCTTCHSPMGRTEALANGAEYYSMDEMRSDTLAMDGVSCTACHQIQDVNLGEGSSFSGGFLIENLRQIFGPYDNMDQQPMVSAVHYFPVYGQQVEQSELCATCHTLFTPTIDNNGDSSGVFPEQVPYLEWKNSIYPENGKQCQSCHMPDTGYPVVISNEPDSLPAWEPYGQHYFVGANVFMLRMFKSHAEEIGVTAEPEHLDSTIARTLRQLRHETIDLGAQAGWTADNALELKVSIKNRAGHKFPTAYPSRRAWIYVSVYDGSGQPVFQSGAWDDQTGEILNIDSPYEPHHDLITTEDDVQIYQALMHDVDDQLTYTLLRGAGYLKDNRLPPEGFSTSGIHYDSTSIEGEATGDPNFNRSGSIEGTAADTVTYRVSGLDPFALYSAVVKILYQSIAPSYASHLLSFDTPEVNTFAVYYNAADKAPITVDSLEMPIKALGIDGEVAIVPKEPLLVNAYPNPFNPDLTVRVDAASDGVLEIVLFNLLGERVALLADSPVRAGRNEFRWNALGLHGDGTATGIYILVVNHTGRESGELTRRAQKVIYMK